MIRSFILSLALSLCGLTAAATEYDLSAYLAEPQAIAQAIGSNDKVLLSTLEAMTAYVADHGLEERFGDKAMWRAAVADLVAGRPRANADINGFALEMVLIAKGEPAAPPLVGAPFADLETLQRYYKARGFGELAAFVGDISFGNTEDDSAGLPSALAGKLGPSEYYAKISVFPSERSKTLLELMPQVLQAQEEMEALQNGGAGSAAGAARQAIIKTETESATAFFSDPLNAEYLDGRTLEAAVSDSVARVLEDPYQYYDHVGQLDEARPAIAEWLGRSARTGRMLFLVYKTY